VIYDQAGTGQSGPLEDPNDHGFDQAVDELARVIDSTGAATVDILGYSWGASIATLFTAGHPDRVGRLAFISPGAIPWRGAEPGRFGPQSRLGQWESISTYLLALSPRNVFVYALTSADPNATRWFAGEAELDRRFRELYMSTAAGLHCSDDQIGPPPARVGFFASQVPQMHPDPAGVTAEALEEVATTPMLVLRGECDYIPARVAEEYLDHFDAKLVAVDGAGHALLEDRPDRVLSDIADFLAEDRSQPVSPRGRGSGPR
jgi:proline iminopeptidase